MSLAQIESDFPRLKTAGYEKTSEESEEYNCFAWALSITHDRVDPYDDPGSHWPEGILATPFLSSFLALFRSKGFEICDDPNLEVGFEKIAIYADDHQQAMHAARLLPSGQWTSKIGDNEDITHCTLQSLEGYYGKVARFMKRPIP